MTAVTTAVTTAVMTAEEGDTTTAAMTTAATG
jgi:hypothetical protein